MHSGKTKENKLKEIKAKHLLQTQAASTHSTSKLECRPEHVIYAVIWKKQDKPPIEQDFGAWLIIFN